MEKQGNHLPAELRQIIFHFHTVMEKSALEIYNDLFDTANPFVSLDRIQKLIKMFDDPARERKTILYIGCGKSRKGSGRPRMLTMMQKITWVSLLKSTRIFGWVN